MKITCERCSAQYDLDENRIPPSGMQMKCPACLHTFVVRKSAATTPSIPAPPKKKEIELSTFHEDEGPTPLPADAPGMMAPAPDEIDLPAPKEYFAPDLPAPKGPSRPPPIPPPKPAATAPTKPPVAATAPKLPSLPPLKKSPPPVPIDGEKTTDDSRLPIARGQAGPGPDEIDLPAPVDPNKHVDLPAPKSAPTARPPQLVDDNLDLLAPKSRSPQVGISLDAPEADDLPSTGYIDDHAGPPALDLDNIDVVAPKLDTPELPAPKHESLEIAPKAESLEITPKAETQEIAPKPQTYDIAPKPETLDVTPRPEATDMAPKATPPRGEPRPERKEAKKKAEPVEDDEAAPPTRRRWGRTLAAVAGVLLLLGGVGVALGMFTDFGQQLLKRGPAAGVEQQEMAARKAMADDTLASYRKAALTLQPLVEGEHPDAEAAALAAQARLAMARLGVTSELRNADAILGKLTDEKASALPDVPKARALRAAVGGNIADARGKLNAILAAAPADAVALVYLGWTELAAGDPAAAERAFAKALAAEPTRVAALYGDGVAKELLGDAAGAREMYGRALARSPSHFGAAVAAARTGKPANEASTEVADLIAKRTAVAAPRELSDAWATVGILAAKQGRRDEAEDRLKRALGLDADNAEARVALSRVQCDRGHCADVIAPLAKLVAAQPKNLPARLALLRAQLETGARDDAAGTLAAAVAQAPKNAQVLYWQGRALLAASRPDREQALQKFKEAVSADPKLIAAYVAESTTFAALGQQDDAVGVLQSAQKQASDDPELMIELGEAYLTLKRPADAEARFRAALEAKPGARGARIDLGVALEAEGKLDEARAQYDQVAKEDGKFPGVVEHQARLAVKQGRKAEAAKLFDEALAQGVPTQALRIAAGQLFLDPVIGRRDEARKLGESVVAEDERSAWGHLLLARAAFDAGHPEEALPEARRAATIEDLPEAHLTLGRVLEAENKLDQAINEFVLARRSTDPLVAGEAQLGRARILVRMGATKDAISELAALAKDPKLRGAALLLTGDAYADLQQADRARHAYEDAVRAAPESSDAAFKLGRALHDAGRRRDAIAQLERSVKLGGDKAQFAAEAQLLLGDAHREGHENEAAVRAYKRYLELAPPDAPARAEVQKHISILGGG